LVLQDTLVAPPTTGGRIVLQDGATKKASETGDTIDFTGQIVNGLPNSSPQTLEIISADAVLPLTNTDTTKHGYMVNTNGGAVNVTLPPDPTDGLEIPIGRTGTNSLFILPNATPTGMTVDGDATSVEFNLDNDYRIAKYIAAANNWALLGN